jgi:hypothetical protein
MRRFDKSKNINQANILNELRYLSKRLLGENDEQADAILDKISATGMESLTPQEKNYLNRLSGAPPVDEPDPEKEKAKEEERQEYLAKERRSKKHRDTEKPEEDATTTNIPTVGGKWEWHSIAKGDHHKFLESLEGLEDVDDANEFEELKEDRFSRLFNSLSSLIGTLSSYCFQLTYQEIYVELTEILGMYNDYSDAFFKDNHYNGQDEFNATVNAIHQFLLILKTISNEKVDYDYAAGELDKIREKARIYLYKFKY